MHRTPLLLGEIVQKGLRLVCLKDLEEERIFTRFRRCGDVKYVRLLL